VSTVFLVGLATIPTQRELQRHITPQYAADWREIGVELGVTDAKLRTIREDNPHSVKNCCNRMFSEWLRVDTSASWAKLLAAIKSPAVFRGLVGGMVVYDTVLVQLRYKVMFVLNASEMHLKRV